MSSDAQSDKMAKLIAEEILRAIYGDDFSGCTVSLDHIAAIVHEGIEERAQFDAKIIELYQTVVVSLQQIATPPEAGKVSGPEELRSLLSERLDAVRAITTKTIDTIARVKGERSGDEL